MPCAMNTSPRTKSKAKPSLNKSLKSKVKRRGKDCKLNTPNKRVTPGSAFKNWPRSMLTVNCPAMVV